MQKELCFALLVTVSAFTVRTLLNKPINHSFEEAVVSFTFGFFSFNASLSIICASSIILPIFTMFILFYDIQRKNMRFLKFTRTIAKKHLLLGYISLCVIYTLDVVYDYLFQSTFSQEIENYNAWHRYILHFMFTPILFLDAIYSIEVELVSSNDTDESKIDYFLYYSAQTMFGAFCVYGLLVILYLDGQLGTMFDEIVNLWKIDRVCQITTYLPVLCQSVMLSVFTALLFGVMDQISGIFSGIFGIHHKTPD